MKSTSRHNEPNYRVLVTMLLDEIVERPGMHPPRVGEFEAMLHGHAVACHELGVLEHWDDQFNWQFMRWLDHRHGWDMTRGWARAIQRRHRRIINARDEFIELLKAYLAEQHPDRSNSRATLRPRTYRQRAHPLGDTHDA